MIKEYFQQYCTFFLKKLKRKTLLTDKKEDFTQIWIIAIPLLIENTLQTLLMTVDRYFASSFDDSAVAAIGVTEIVMNLYLSFFIAVNVGVSVVIGKNVGKNDIKQAGIVATQGIYLSIIVGVVTGLSSLMFGRQFLLFTGCPQEILSYALPYFMAVAVPAVFLSLSLTLSACLRATKDTKTPMLLTFFVIFSIYS